MGKTNPLNDEDLREFFALQRKKPETPKSWSLAAKDIDGETYDLSVANPNEPEAAAHKTPEDILEEIAALDVESAAILDGIRNFL